MMNPSKNTIKNRKKKKTIIKRVNIYIYIRNLRADMEIRKVSRKHRDVQCRVSLREEAHEITR